MKKNYCGLTCFVLIPMVLMISVGLLRTTVRAEDQPAGKTSVSSQPPSATPQGMSEAFRGTVAEVINAGRHMYVHIDTGERRIWVAVPAFGGKIGDEVLVPPGVPVADFQSRTLNRKFKMMIFVGAIRRVDRNKAK
jgi:hypothetical protein